MAPLRYAGHRVYKKLQELAASLPEAVEVEAWEHPTFRVRGKIFATFYVEDGQAFISVKSTLSTQAALTAGPDFFVPKYVGKHGWIGIVADRVEWELAEELVEDSYRRVAPKQLVRQFDDTRGGA